MEIQLTLPVQHCTYLYAEAIIDIDICYKIAYI
jgi:hypothetical protein